MSDSGLNIDVQQKGNDCLITLRGDVDLNTSPELRARLLELIQTHGRRLLVDLADVQYMDSSGVGTLVELKRKIERRGGSVVLARPRQRVRSVFEITQLDRFFTIKDNIEEARKP